MADTPVIAYVGGFEFPNKNAAASRALAVADLCKAVGYDVALIGTDKNPHRGPKDLFGVQIPGNTNDIWSVGYPRSQKEWLMQITNCDPILDHLDATYGDRLQAVIFYNYPAVSQYRARTRLMKAGKMALADVTEWYEDGLWTSIRSAVKNLDTRLRMYLVNPRMTALITTSPFLTRFYAKEDRPSLELPTLLTRSDAFADHTRAQRGDVPRLFFAGSGFDAVAYAGRPDLLKDRLDWCIELLHTAHQNGSRFVFDIYGVDQAAFLTICPDLASAVADLGDALVFHGRQPRDLLLGTLWDADYAYFLRKRMKSTDAGFPTKLSEPLTHGVPVLTNHMENIMPFVISGETGDLIDLQASDRGVQTLEVALARSPAEREIMLNRCMSEQPFHVENYLESTALFLRDLIKSQDSTFKHDDTL